MIIFDRLWRTMKQKGISTYALREKHNVDTKTIQRLRKNMNMETDTLARLCKILECNLEDIAEYKAD